MPRRNPSDLPSISSAENATSSSSKNEVPSFLDEGEEELSSLMQKSLGDLSGKDMQSVKDAIMAMQTDKGKLEQVREIMQESGMEEEIMKKVARGVNAHGETVPKRKMVLKAKKEAKKMVNTATQTEFAAEYKGIYINCSRKIKVLSYTYPNLTTLLTKTLSTSTPRFTQWGEVIVVHDPAKGHLRNKLVEKLFSRDASFGAEVFVFRYEEDLENENSLRTILDSNTEKVTPVLWELPSSSS